MTRKIDYSKNISGTDDCCGNCTSLEYYLKVPKCKKINSDLDMADFRPVDNGICPLHNRPLCVKCETKLHWPMASYCDDCKQALIEEANEEVIVNVLTGEVLGKRKDLSPIKSEMDLI